MSFRIIKKCIASSLFSRSLVVHKKFQCPPNHSFATKVNVKMANSSARYYAFKAYGYWASFNSWLVETVTPDKYPILPPIESEILLKSASQITKEIKAGSLTCVQVIEAYLDRIESTNHIINAIVEVTKEDALKNALKLDEEIKSARSKTGQDIDSVLNKPLLGVPITIKNSISVEGCIQDAGLWRARNRRAAKDSIPVSQLKEAGAIIIGITNVPEALVFWESKNKVHGVTSNPYDLSRVVGGSSGGEGAALGSACSLVGLGSDMAGSVRIPAACCGVFGHKPSVGVIESFDKFFPDYSKNLWPYLTLGPMARYADDLKLALSVVGRREHVKKLQLEKDVDFTKLKIYILNPDPENLLQNPTKPEIIETIKKAADHFEKVYGTPVIQYRLKNVGKSMSIWGACVKDADPSSLISLLEGTDDRNNNTEGTVIWPRLEMVKGALGLSNHNYYTMYLAVMDSFLVPDKKKISRLLDLKKQLMSEVYSLLGEDAVIFYPTLPYEAPKHNTVLFKVSDCCYCGLFNILEMPATHITMGLDPKLKLPIGFQVAACPNMDRLCLSVASELSKVFGGWTCPSAINTSKS